MEGSSRMFSMVLHDLVVDWGSFYANHAAVRTMVLFGHVGGIIAAGGAAVTADRGIIRAMRVDAADRGLQLATVQATHRVVIGGLVFVALSGLLLFASDVDTFLNSRVFWTKMTLVLLLLINGAVLTSAERSASLGHMSAWPTLRLTAFASIALWFLTALAGVALTTT
jgi:hypothetical protein